MSSSPSSKLIDFASDHEDEDSPLGHHHHHHHHHVVRNPIAQHHPFNDTTNDYADSNVIIEDGSSNDGQNGNGSDAHAGSSSLLRVVSVPMMIGMCFFSVSGGPYGMEGLFSSAPPLIVLISFVLLPWVWSLCLSFVTIELSLLYPEDGGSPIWISQAFRPLMQAHPFSLNNEEAKSSNSSSSTHSSTVSSSSSPSISSSSPLLSSTHLPSASSTSSMTFSRKKFHASNFISFVYTFVYWCVYQLDGALYPIIILQYVAQIASAYGISDTITSASGMTWQGWLVCLVVVSLVTAFNLTGAAIVGGASIVLGILTMSPFVCVVILAFVRGYINSSSWGIWTSMEGSDDMNLGLFISMVVWNAIGWEDVATVAGEVANPARTFSRALPLAVVLDTLSNLVPLAIGFCVHPVQDDWQEGYFGQIAQILGGAPLATILSLGGIISNLGLLNSDMCASSRVLFWWAKTDMLPSKVSNLLGKLYFKRHVPVFSVLFNSAIVLCLVWIPFDLLLEFDVVAMSLCYLIVFISFVRLRFVDADAHRDFKLPGSKWVSIIYVLPPTALLLLQLIYASSTAWICAGGLVGLSIVMFLLNWKLNNRLPHHHKA
eukprot:TRINITY_DN1560_c0_g2_i1.p1 TRINITY_DN1560_c0_g2~~TRINITY_DN1560_c0_g2_i1.p1  ORF type:complete len:601 (+),score=121.14 TRINITY_DN1560_c0_g2_i1:109-1911(+)